MTSFEGVEESTEIPDIPELPETDHESGTLTRVPAWLQIAWFVLGFVFFAFHAYGTRGQFPWHPTTDLVSLAWLSFAMIALIVNRLDRVGFAGATLSFRRDLKNAKRAAFRTQSSVAKLNEAIDDYASTLQSWTNATNLFLEHLERYGVNEERVSQLFVRFCLERMEEARDLIADADDYLRMSYWSYNSELDGLQYAFSDNRITDDETLNHVFSAGSGLMGQCFIEARLFNLADAPASIYYESIKDRPDYHGLLLIPVTARTDGGVLGVLSIDRKKRKNFSNRAENVARAVADLIAFATAEVSE